MLVFMKHTQPNLDFEEGSIVSREDYGKFTADEGRWGGWGGGGGWGKK